MQLSNLRVGSNEDIKVAIVTGATGLLGKEVCLGLASQGWKLGLLVHQDMKSAHELLAKVREIGSDGIIIQSDLLNSRIEAPKIVLQLQKAFGSIHLFVHTANLSVNSSGFIGVPDDLEKMFSINVTAYLSFVAALLPGMLSVQTGTFISILSQAIFPPSIPGWHSYTIAKVALAQAAVELAKAYEESGVRAISILPGAFRSNSKVNNEVRNKEVYQALRSRWPQGVEPKKVAEIVLQIVNDNSLKSGTAISYDAINGIRVGQFGTCLEDNTKDIEHHGNNQINQSSKSIEPSDHKSKLLAKIIGEAFGLSDSEDIRNAEIGITAGWDSLANIKLLIEVESAFNVSFSSVEAASLRSYAGILEALTKKQP